MSGPAARSLVSVVAFLRSLVRSGETLSADDNAMIDAAIAAHAAEQAGQRARAEKLEKRLRAIVKIADDLCFECDGVFATRAPSRNTYNRTFEAIDAEKKLALAPETT